MATTTEKYIVEVSAKLVGDEVFQTLTARVQQLQRDNVALKRSLSETGVAFRNTANSGSNAAAGLGRISSLFQNVSYQITDLAVQTSNGVDAFRAFGQQAPQIAGALGAAGIGGAAGIAAFAVAGLASAMVPAIRAFFQTEDALAGLDTQLEKLKKNRLDARQLLGNPEETAEWFDALTTKGKQLAESIETIAGNQTLQQSKLLREQIRLLTKDILDFQLVFQGGTNVGGKYYQEVIENLNEALGISLADASKIGPLLQKALNPKQDSDSAQALTQVIAFFKTINASGDASANVDKLVQALSSLLELQIEANRESLQNPAEDKEAIKSLESMTSQWDQIVKSLRTAKQEYGDQVLLVYTLGNALNKPKEEVQRIVELLSERRAKDFFKEAGIDARTFAEGVAEANKATNELFVSAEYLAGVRQAMNEATDENKWAAMARLLKEAATPAEQLRLALHDIRQEASDSKEFSAAINELYKAGKITAQELELLKKQFVDTKETATDVIDEIGIAIGNSLSTQVGRFVDTLYDAEASFGDMAQAMLRDIAKLITQLVILRQIQMATAGTEFGNFLFGANAKGNVFSKGQVTPFANGGIVSKPTIFPMANGIGLMGEAGPEAIMPLSRGADGKLGVKSQPVTVNVINNSGATATVSESEDSNGALRIDVLVENAVDSAISRGRFDKSLSNLYGLRRRGA